MSRIIEIKDKERYLVVSILVKKDIDFEELLKNTFKEIFGILELSKAKIKIIDKKKQKDNIFLIIRVNHTYINHLKFAIGVMKLFYNFLEDIIFIDTVGTIKKARLLIKENAT